MIVTKHVCDRCGKTIDYTDKTGKIEKVKKSRFLHWKIIFGGGTAINKCHELCSDCLKSFEKWLYECEKEVQDDA